MKKKQSPAVQTRAPAPPSLALKHVLDLNAFRGALCLSSQRVVSAAGGTVSLFSLDSHATRILAKAGNSKKVVSLAASDDGVLVAAGEAGHQPRITIWNTETQTVSAELVGHKFGVLCLAFSPNGKFLVSVGYQHDGQIYVWNIASGLKVACNRISAKITSVCFDDSGLFFITSGFRHFKYWAFDSTVSVTAPAPLSLKASQQQQHQNQQQIPLVEGTFAIVGEHKNSLFMDLVYYRDLKASRQVGHAYSITEKGILVNGGYSLAICTRFIVCGCSDGVIRLFEPTTMKYIATLPKPHYLGIDVAHSVGASYSSQGPSDAKFPDVISVKVDPKGHYIAAIYRDKSLFVWDVKDVKHIGKFKSFLNHSDCVWGVEMVPIKGEELPTPTTDISKDDISPPLPPHGLPPNAFVTYSSDTTIRFWNVDNNNGSQEGVGRYFRRNIYSKELLKILYTNVEEFVTTQKAVDDETAASQPTHDKTGIRSLKISVDGAVMAAGDRSGNLRIYELDTFTQQRFLEAHDGEILGIDFASGLMATASRDRLIHVFDVRNSFNLIQTLDDHTSSITGVKFSEEGKKLMSSAADKLIPTLSSVDGTSTNQNNGILKVAFDPSGRYAVTAAADKCIRVFDLNSGVVVARGWGHSEVITCVKFSLDCKFIVSTWGGWVCFCLDYEGAVGQVEKGRWWREEDEDVDTRAALLPPSGAGYGPRSAVLASQPTDEKVGLMRTTSSGSDFMTVFNDDGDLPVWARTSGGEGDAEEKQQAANTKSDAKTLLMQRGMWAKRLEEGEIQLFSEAKDNQKPVATVSSLFDRRYSIESSIGNLTRAGSSSGSLPSNDLVVQDVVEAVSETVVASDPSSNQISATVDEPVIFEDSGTCAVDPASEVTAFVIAEPSQKPTDTEEEYEEYNSSEEKKSESIADDDDKYLNTPVDPSMLRQSISAKHVMSRDPTRKFSGGIVVEAVLEQIREQQANFEAAVIGSTAIRVDTKPVFHEMAEKKPVLRALPSLQLTRTSSAVNKEVIESIAMSEKVDDLYDEDSFEDGTDDVEEDKIDVAQVLKDLNKLKSLTDASSSLLRKLQAPSRVNTVEEDELSQELRNTLNHIKSSAESALAVMSPEVDSNTAALLEQYSNLLVGLVREKLATKIGQEQ
ncbi:WD40-repeat-containing domain protein, partial [Obelidium mucronatum]